MTKENPFRNIPSVDTCLRDERMLPYNNLPHALLVQTIREISNNFRKNIPDDLNSSKHTFDIVAFWKKLTAQLEQLKAGYLKRVVNATGIIVHTNLGRSIFSPYVIENLTHIISGYNNLEYDIEKGQRSSRYEHLTSLLRELTGYEDSLIVNNNASAVLLILDTFAFKREVIISRSELVEIGGGFRIPDVMKKAGTFLVETGCTNKTYLEDYKQSISEQTSMIIKVHRSNFSLTGFTSEPDLSDLTRLAREKKLLFYYDLGSGNILPAKLANRLAEPDITYCRTQHVPLVSFSGDKLLGGPQAGIILGSTSLIEKLKKNQLLRALRVDKMCLAALEATLKLYFSDENTLYKNIPTLRMLTTNETQMKKRAIRFINKIKRKKLTKFHCFQKEGFSQLGGGSLPSQMFKTTLVAIEHETLSVTKLDEKMRQHLPPIIGRITNDIYVIDLRTVLAEEEKFIIEALIEF